MSTTRMNPGLARRRAGNAWHDEIVGAQTAGSAEFVELRVVEATTVAIFRDTQGGEWAQTSRANPSKKQLPPGAHKSPPAKYRALGFSHPSDYAYPAAWEYPIGGPKFTGKPDVAATHTRNAAARFAQFKKNIPASDRAAVANAIDRAKRRWSVGTV